MGRASANHSLPLARSIVLDRDRRIVESDVPSLVAGTIVTRTSWLGGSVLDAVDAASQQGRPQSRAGRDDAQATHWIVQASVEPETANGAPWRARVVIVDATLAVTTDRNAVLGKLVHAMQNSCFALQSVVEAITEDRPSGPELDEYVGHLREPTERISTTMSRLNTYLVAPDLRRKSVSVASFVEDAVGRLPESRRPKTLRVSDAPMTFDVDRELLSEAFAVLFDGDDPAAVVDVERLTVDGRPRAGIVVERRELLAEDRTLAGHWDLAGGHRFEMALRFSIARAIVLAHGGEVLSSTAVRGRARLGFHLPLTSDA